MGDSQGEGPDSRDELIRASSRYLGHGMALAASVALFGWVGAKVGQRFGAEDALTLLGILVGGAAGFYSMYVQLVVRPREEHKRETGGSEKD
jgi:hypothetical protein